MLRLHQYRFHQPRSLPDALDLLVRDDARAIAGGTDLVPNMKHELFSPNHLVSLSRIPEMRGITLLGPSGDETDQFNRATELAIGAAETLHSVSTHPLVRRFFPSLARAAGTVAGPQIRNRGTLGGNLCLETRCTYYNQTRFWREALGFCLKKDGTLCHVTRVGRKCVAANSADTPPVLITLAAIADLSAARQDRSVPVAGFFVADGIRNTVLRPGEVVRRVRLPLPPEGFTAGYAKLRQRKSIDFPLLTVACAAVLGRGQTVRSLSVVVSALGARPRVISGIEERVAGMPMADAIEAVATLAHRQSHPLENLIVDPDWRRAMVPVHVRRVLREMAGIEGD